MEQSFNVIVMLTNHLHLPPLQNCNRSIHWPACIRPCLLRKNHAGSYVYNSTKGIKERIARLVLMHSNHREEVDELKAGDIGAGRWF